MPTLRLLCLDFDGVICNSLDECMLITFNTYFNARHVSLDALPPAYCEMFRRHRYLVRDPGEYYLLANWYEHGEAADSSSFGELRHREASACQAFKPKFFAARRIFRSGQPQAWLALHPPYKEAVDFLRRNHVPVCIVTTKDEESVKLLLREYGVLHWVDRVYGQEALTRLGGKANAIRDACRQAGIDAAEVRYLDDHLQHLADVRATGVGLWYATWGYTDPQAPHVPDYVRPVSLDRIQELAQS